MFSAISSLLWCSVLVYLIRTANIHITNYLEVQSTKQLTSTQSDELKEQIKELRADVNALRIDAGMKG